MMYKIRVCVCLFVCVCVCVGMYMIFMFPTKTFFLEKKRNKGPLPNLLPCVGLRLILVHCFFFVILWIDIDKRLLKASIIQYVLLGIKSYFRDKIHKK